MNKNLTLVLGIVAAVVVVVAVGVFIHHRAMGMI